MIIIIIILMINQFRLASLVKCSVKTSKSSQVTCHIAHLNQIPVLLKHAHWPVRLNEWDMVSEIFINC